MSFKFIVSSNLRKTLSKLTKNDRTLALALRKKIEQIINYNSEGIHQFKNLRSVMSDYKRVYIGRFVLMFKIDDDTIIFDRFVHHNDAYK